ncbi:MAG TPA: hypothetical protein VLF90_02480 [Patescibacteria group bacterium]|nr:hypothetical protein [Patescibacteria group bacterium]
MPNSFVRKDGKAGPVDLSLLAESGELGLNQLQFRTKTGLWYKLRALRDTHITQDNRISPVQLDTATEIVYSDGIEDLVRVPIFAFQALRNWATESRYFPRHGEVSLTAGIVDEGGSLEINGWLTSPIQVCWVNNNDGSGGANF